MISPPLSLYVHLPWCVRKCPYCDFNSHAITAGSLPEQDYVAALLRDLAFSAARCRGREIISVFFGGGTPSLMSAQALDAILDAIAAGLSLSADAEITLEANPGSADSRRFAGYRRLGINRISIGVQSFNDAALDGLGRIHNAAEAAQAIAAAEAAGFSNINLDLMYGLPEQTAEQALSDLQQALAFEPRHLSWYQLTLEPNTAFYAHPPSLPDHDALWEMQARGQDCLERHGYRQYEVSAWRRDDGACLHNLNYWEFGDYLGIGAGAHEKITSPAIAEVARQSRRRLPASYIEHAGSASVIAGRRRLAETDLILEFLLNGLRLKEGIPWRYFRERTGLAPDVMQKQVAAAREDGLLQRDDTRIQATARGWRYLDELLQYFLPEPEPSLPPLRRHSRSVFSCSDSPFPVIIRETPIGRIS